MGVVAAVLVQPVVFVALWPVMTLMSSSSQRAGLDETLVYAGVSAVVALPFVVVLGVPAFLMLRRFRALSVRSVGLAGFGIATLPLIVQDVVKGAGLALSNPAALLLFGAHGFAGAVAGFLAWRRFGGMPGIETSS